MIDILIKSNYCEITIFTLIFLYQHMTMPNSSDLRKTMKVPDSLMVPLKEKNLFIFSSGHSIILFLDFFRQFSIFRSRIYVSIWIGKMLSCWDISRLDNRDIPFHFFHIDFQESHTEIYWYKIIFSLLRDSLGVNLTFITAQITVSRYQLRLEC